MGSGSQIAAVLVAGVVLGGLALAGGDDGRYTRVPLDQVKAEVTAGKAYLVDVRETREWDRGHLRDARLVPLSRLMAWDRDGLDAAGKAELEKLIPKGSVIYCHCAAGARALPAGELLGKFGYQARPLRNGYGELLQAGFPGAGK